MRNYLEVWLVFSRGRLLGGEVVADGLHLEAGRGLRQGVWVLLGSLGLGVERGSGRRGGSGGAGVGVVELVVGATRCGADSRVAAAGAEDGRCVNQGSGTGTDAASSPSARRAAAADTTSVSAPAAAAQSQRCFFKRVFRKPVCHSTTIAPGLDLQVRRRFGLKHT